jgi:hypothetical protein
VDIQTEPSSSAFSETNYIQIGGKDVATIMGTRLNHLSPNTRQLNQVVTNTFSGVEAYIKQKGKPLTAEPEITTTDDASTSVDFLESIKKKEADDPRKLLEGNL